MTRIFLSISGTALLGVLSSACASTGAVPKPFPLPSTSRPVGAPRPGSAPGPAVDTYDLVGAALKLRGAPYRNGGADPTGFDCSGFTQYVFAQYGVSLPRTVRDQFAVGRQVGADEIAAGDLLFFTTTDSAVSHVGIAVGGDQFVHAPSSTGVVRVEHLGAKYWSDRYLGARRPTQP